MKKNLLVANGLLMAVMVFVLYKVIRTRADYQDMGMAESLDANLPVLGLSFLQEVLIVSPIGFILLVAVIGGAAYFLIKDCQANTSENMLRVFVIVLLIAIVYIATLLTPIF